MYMVASNTNEVLVLLYYVLKRKKKHVNGDKYLAYKLQLYMQSATELCACAWH